MNEKMKLNFGFYYGKDAEQFNFYRIPKLLFTDKGIYRAISNGCNTRNM